ncbi:MAG TPA: TonB-dependent receptor [Fulvivirga sp.]|nr:TonB-dependent receptor [Fulvivirga sp.]
MSKYLSILSFIFAIGAVHAQSGTITGKIIDESGKPISGASIFLIGTSYNTQSNSKGRYQLDKIPFGQYTIACFSTEKQTEQKSIDVSDKELTIDFALKRLEVTLDEVTITGEQGTTSSLAHLSAVENFGINEAKKNEVILLRNITSNTATNNPRQIYSKITGLNIWESDQAGLQLGIGGRGLSPDRTSNFNTRQNGYDISADALGYPESYYTPPAEALDKIEIIRGAASLQYGTQFGGMVNFRFKKGPENKKIELTTRQTAGSWGFFSSFNSIGGTVAKGKVNYYTYYNYKRGDGYRPNSEFDFHNAFISISYSVSDKLLINTEYTKMAYQAHQPGGLTDKLFEDNPRQSVRERNWFKVDWNLMAVNLTYRFSPRTQLNIRNFGLIAERQSIGNLERINVADFNDNRTLIDGTFNNIGNETRLLHRYKIFGKQNALLVGFRIYSGETTADQGFGNNESGPDFYFLNPDNLENSSYTFPNYNYSLFAENIFDLTDKLSITPGLRLENIQTFSDGYYKQRVLDGAGNIIVENTINENLNRKRSFLIAGLGISYKLRENTELYGNISQNYRAINFTDLRIVNPNFVVDPNIKDESGYTADMGLRGKLKDIFSYELTGFYLSYKDKIGQVLRADQPPLYNDFRFRGNISDARTIGLEAFGEVSLSNLIDIKPNWTLFANTSIIDARYVNSEDASVEGKQVEMVPPLIIRTGTSFKMKPFSFSFQYSYSAKHYTDATNAERTATAIEGAIPAYMVVDISAKYAWKKLSAEATCNNALNASYFTRRADSYPGPGIIPADGRGFYVTLQLKL